MPTVIYPYLYKSSGWRDQLVSYNGETFEYDELGNPTTCRGETFVWNGRQLVQLGDCKYTYNANGIRTSKIVNGIKTKFFLNGNKILAQNDGNKIYYHYGVDGIVGFTLKLSDTIIYDYIYKKNIQGDIIGIYDSNNALICKYIYDAWGNHKTLILSNNGEYVDISSTSDYTNINNNYIFIANLNPFRYRGYYFDTDTGLYYLNTRYYDPELGRFINADAIDILNTAQEELNGLNLYAYCFNNPVNDIDENGNWSWKRFWKAVLVIAVVVVAVTITVATAGAGSVAGSIIAGGIISAGGEIFNQTVIQNKTFSNINWLQVGVAGVGGMLSAIPGVGFVGGILIGGGTNALSTAIGGGSLEEIGISFLVGAFSSAVGYAASSIINRASTARLASKLTNMSKSQFKFQVRNYFRASEINTVKTLSLALSKDPNLLNKLSNKILPLIFDNIFSFITENVFS